MGKSGWQWDWGSMRDHKQAVGPVFSPPLHSPPLLPCSSEYMGSVYNLPYFLNPTNPSLYLSIPLLTRTSSILSTPVLSY